MAASNFTSTLTPDGIRANKAQLEDLWVKRSALVKLNKKDAWLVATGVTKAKDPQVILSENSTTRERDAALASSVLADKAKRERVADRIIMGFIGGEFVHDGLTACPLEVAHAREGSVVTYTLFDVDGERVGGRVTSAVDAFLEEFPPGEVAVTTRQVR
jgi:hypothetical protein